MNKTYSMSIRVSEEELNKLKQAAKIESYSSYSEFVRRTVLKESDKILSEASYNELPIKANNALEKESQDGR